MVAFAGLKGPYAIFIIVLMVLGVVAGAFYFYNAASKNPCGDPGNAVFSALPDTTIDVNGQPKTYHAIAANFTGTGQVEVIQNVAFLTTDFNDPLQPHLINGSCGRDPYTPVSITVKVTFSQTGSQQYLGPVSFRGTTPSTVDVLTNDSQAGLLWNPNDAFLTLLVAA